MGNLIDDVLKYKHGMLDAFNCIDYAALDALNNLMYSANPLFVMGNGGSAGIAEHFCVDYNKGVGSDTNMTAKVISLTSNIPTITAIANDIGYDYVFSKQIEYYSPDRGSVLAISSSGNSKNIINGLKTAKHFNLETFAFVGFDGGIVKKEKLADNIIHININNYGIVEDMHQILLHILTQYMRKEYYKFKPDSPKL